MDAHLELLVAALAAPGDPVVVLDGDQVVARSGDASLLGDPAALLAIPPGAAPERREAPGGRVLEVRAQVAGSLRVVFGRDVTEREELRAQVARSDEILSIGSHEMKGPLHVIGMICHLIETRAQRGEPVDTQTLDRLRRQVTRLTRLLNELLDAARLQEGRMVLEDEEVDLAELVREQLEATVPARRADLVVTLPEHAMLRGDRTRLGAVCFQLIDNAVRFTQQGTPVRVTLSDQGPSLCLAVVDEGPGVSPAEVPQLFRRQPRKKSHERQGHGLGLGLFVAAAAVRLHQGTLDYAPGPRGGASFTVRLPRAT